jgi:hypothetical protein
MPHPERERRVNIADEAACPVLQPAPPTEAAMAAFLRSNPGWLAAQDELYALMDPPRRVHGERMADHMAALLLAARSQASHLAAAAALATTDRRASEGFAQRVQDAVLALMRAPDPAWCLQHDLPALLRLDSARLCVEGVAGVSHAAVPPGTVAAALGQRQAVVRADPSLPALHGEAAALAGWEALVRVPLRQGPALLALACRDGRALAGAATPALSFLGQAVAAALDPGPHDLAGR